MEKLERLVSGFYFLLGGVFLLIFMVFRLVDFFSRAFSYFLLIFFIILMLYGVILISIGILIMPFQIRLKKRVSLTIFFIGLLILILSFTTEIRYSFTPFNILEIFSGIGIIFLGIWVFFHPKLKKEWVEKGKMAVGVLKITIGSIISLPYGYSLIMTMVFLSPEYAFYEFPFSLLPFLIGIILIKTGIYSIKTTHSTQERKNKSVFLILMGELIILTSYFAINSMVNLSYYLNFYTPYFPVIFSSIGIVLLLHGFFLQYILRKKHL